MKRAFGNIFTVVLCLLLVSCGGKKSRSVSGEGTRQIPQAPKAPTMITDGAEAVEYTVSHFWDAFLEGDYLCDSAHVNGVSSEEVESALGMYVTLLEGNCKRTFAEKEVDSFFAKVESYSKEHPSSNVFSFFEKMVPKYLYDPNSPVRDEDLYLPFVSNLAESELVAEDMKPAYSHDADMCALNQVGSQAADFSFTDLSGRLHTLHGMKGEYTLLMFTNPGCDACHDVIESIKSNADIPKLVKEGTLSVVNVYIDLEREKWQALAKEYPTEWHNGYDQDFAIRQNLTYNVRGIPSLYILDRDKNVIMKDATTEKVIVYLQNIQKHQ
ncbi:MAG: DUF5106 domain-containing protein [Bacteroidales bacterium]|nr:DUF5106 domain-containing protein [Bacteroidales bacterium]